MDEKGPAEGGLGAAENASGAASIRATVVLELRAGLSALEVDRRIVLANRAGDVGARALAFYLVDLADRGVHQELGFPSVVRYAEMRLHMPATTTREHLSVGRALQELPAIDEAFRSERLLWSQVRQLVRVATPQTEESWVEWARGRSAREIASEVARKRKGELPTDPARRRIHTTRFKAAGTFDEIGWQIWCNARAKLEAETGRPVDDGELMLEAARLILATRPDGSVPGRRPVNDSHFKVLLIHHEQTGATALQTPEGPMALDVETASAVLRQAGREDLADIRRSAASCGRRENSGPEVPPEERDVPTPPDLRAREKAPGEIFRCGKSLPEPSGGDTEAGRSSRTSSRSARTATRWSTTG